MSSRREALAILTAGAAALAGCSSPSRHAFTSFRPATAGAGPTPSVVPRPPSRALTAGTGPQGSVNTTGTSDVALTFDDGPDPGNTPKILDLLAQYEIKASFSLVGWRARDHPDLVRRIAAAGHTLCNHSWQHLMDLGQRPLSYVKWDLASTIEAIHTGAPETPVRYFRAPGGNFTPALVQLARQYGMTPLSWNVDPRDWDSAHYGFGGSMVRHIVETVEAHVRPGVIVLSHDCKHPDTIAAYATLLPRLKQRYNLIPLPT